MVGRSLAAVSAFGVGPVVGLHGPCHQTLVERLTEPVLLPPPLGLCPKKVFNSRFFVQLLSTNKGSHAPAVAEGDPGSRSWVFSIGTSP